MAVDWKGAAESASKLDYDPAEAVAMQKLLMKKIQQRLNVLSETFKKHGHLGKGKDKIAKLLKESDFEASKIFKNKNTEGKALRRGLAEMLTTNPDFFAKRGLWDIFQQDLSLLEGDKLFSTLKGWDNSISGFKPKTGKVGHHTTLSSLNEALQGTSEKWRVEFNQLAEADGYKIGTEGISQYSPGVHKAFSTKKGDPNTRMVKGLLAEKLAPLMPDATFSGGRLEVTKGVNPKFDAFLDKLQSISTHGNWAGGEVGFKVPRKVEKLSTDEAFKVAKNTLGAEEAIADHGRKIDKNLERYLNNTEFKSLDEALDGLNKKVNQKNWQPPNVRDTLIKETDISLNQAKQTEPLDVLDRPDTKGGLDYDSPNVPGEDFDMSPKLREGRQWMMKMQDMPGAKALTKVGGGINKAEAAAMIVGGQYIPGTVALAMQSKPVQTQIGKLLAKQGLKIIPGVSFGSGVLQGAGYALSGKYGKAALSVAGGVAGEVPGYGDVVQGMIDLGLTVDDIKQAKAQPQGDPSDPLNRNNKKQFEVEAQKVKPSSIGDAFTDTLQKTGKVTKNLL